MIATVKLYKSTKILDEKNYMVDSLTDYLATLSNTLEYTINYFKFDKLEPTLKLQLRQENIEMLSANDYNYVSILNEGTTSNPSNTRTYYYFITNKIWKSENCIELQLKLDTLNTFTYNTDYVVSPRTKVLREHRDRYKLITPKKIIVESYGTVITEATIIPGTYTKTYTFTSASLVGISGYTVSVECDVSGASGAGVIDTTTGVLTITILTLGSAKTVNFKFVVFIASAQVLCRDVDRIPEGINPILYKGREENIIQTELNTSWNVIYKNKEDIAHEDNPVECYACADTPLKVGAPTLSRLISYSDLAVDKYYFIGSSNNYGAPISFKDSSGYEYNVKSETTSNIGYYQESSVYIVLHRASGNNYFDITYHSYTSVSAPAPVGTRTIEQVLYTASNITSLEVLSSRVQVDYAIADNSSFSPFTTTQSGHFSFTVSDKYVNSLDGVDRTDSKLIKIFKIPYAPSKLTIDNDIYSLDENWDYDSITLLYKLNNLNTKFNYTFETPIQDPTEKLNAPFTSILTNNLKNIEYESKLYNSEFYSPKIVYDSFSFTYALEKVDLSKYKGLNTTGFLKVGFVMTTTINSKFMFYFPNYELLDFLKTQDYDKYMPIARNNEVVLYTSQYINYIRTGYNYDVKAKERTQTASSLGLGLGITGSLASMGLGIASMNPAVAIGGIIGGVSSIVSNVVSTINTISSSEMAIASKLEQLKNQAVSVAGSDDIDLLEVYSDNKAKVCEWRCSDNMRKAIFDLFFYCGYATNEMKIPDLNTRYRFNFVQAELELNETNNLPDFVVNDLIARFKNGITKMHKATGTNYWDWTQHYENWEVSLLS